MSAFDNSANSHLNFYLTGFYNGSYHSMEPLTEGSKLVFFYQLIRKNVADWIPQDIPAFVAASKEIGTILDPWKSQKQMRNVEENAVDGNTGLFYLNFQVELKINVFLFALFR